MKKILALLLALTLALSLFAGCAKEPAKTPDEPAGPVEPEIQRTPEEQILWDRRVTAETYLRNLAKVRWRSNVDLEYTHTSGQENPWKIVAGRLYEGLPYSYAGASLGTWLDHPHTTDEKGIHTMDTLTVELLGGSSTSSRLGIDCSGTMSHAWQAAGAKVRTESTNAMTPANGYIRVGEYTAPENAYTSTKADCASNGMDVMFNAYAQLQKGDGVVSSNGGGHARFVADVNVVRNENGKVIGAKSTVTIIEQFGLMASEAKYYDEALGEDVYMCITVDSVYTFASLFREGYLPVTNKIFVDPSPIEDPVVTYNVKAPTKDNMLYGTLKCNWALDNASITITDASGAVVQSAVLHPQRRSELNVSMAQFTSDGTAGKTVGTLNLKALPAGTYHVVIACRTVAGHEMTAAEFDITA